MPDSDPSSTSSARSSRDFPTEEGGDRCRRDGLRLARLIPQSAGIFRIIANDGPPRC